MSTPTLFSPLARRAVLVVGLISFIGTVAVLLYGGDLVEPDPGPRDSYGRGVLGHRALYQTLDALGFSVTRLRRGRYTRVRPPVLFIEPAMEAHIQGKKRFELDKVLQQRADESLSSIVVLPKWRCAGDPVGSPLVTPEKDGAAEAVLGAAFPDEERPRVKRASTPAARPVEHEAEGLLGDFSFRVAWLQTVPAPPDAEVLLETDQGALVLRHPSTGTLVITDPDLLHNWNLQRTGNTGIVAALLRRVLRTDTVYVDEVFHGHGKELSLGQALGSWPAVLLSAHGLALALLFLWAGLTRFGPPRAPDSGAPRRGPAEMIDTSAAVLAAGQPPGLLASEYIHIVLHDLAERLGAHESATPAARTALVDRAAERAGRPHAASRLLSLAGALVASPRSAAAALRGAREAWDLYELLLGDQHALMKPQPSKGKTS